MDTPGPNGVFTESAGGESVHGWAVANRCGHTSPSIGGELPSSEVAPTATVAVK